MLAAAYRYNAFGLFIHSGIIHSPWLFSSQRYDHATSFYHFDKREYDPNIGRWLTPDPLGFSDGPNLYAYVHNNPLIYVDHYGLFWAEAGEFGHGFTRGFFDDTTYGGSSYLCGNYHSPSTLGNWGYNFGTGTSMAAGLLYGGAEVRLLKGAATGVFLGANKIRQSWFACNQATTTAKALHETHQVAKLASEAVSAPTILKVSQAAERNAINRGWINEGAKKGVQKLSSVDLVIKETLQSKGMITSQYKLSASEALQAGEKFLGAGYREVGKPGRGVFRSTDGLRQFRIDTGSITGSHAPGAPHIHMEAFKIDAKEPYINNHILFYE